MCKAKKNFKMKKKNVMYVCLMSQVEFGRLFIWTYYITVNEIISVSNFTCIIIRMTRVGVIFQLTPL